MMGARDRREELFGAMQKSPVETGDGSKTLYSSEFDECYHSTKEGALKESLKKHVEPAFSLLPEKDEIKILDICFGLGYNTLCTLYYMESMKIDSRVRIYAPELDRELVQSLVEFDYPAELKGYADLVEALSREGRYVGERVEIELIFADARKAICGLDSIDIVYQDPFSPRKNPLLWTREYFADIRSIVSDDVVLTTYSCATAVRMGLYENGFRLYEAPYEELRKGTIASLRELPLVPIDMELKKMRNPSAASMRDAEFVG